ncbi:MAG: mechanosensitive ion channel family protein [Arenicella sp.]
MMDKVIQTFESWLGLPYLSLLNEPWVRFVLILAVFVIAAKLLNFVIHRSARFFETKTANDVDDAVFQIIRGPVFWGVALVGLRVALLQFTFEDSLSRTINALILSAVIIIVIVGAYRVTKLLLSVVSKVGREGSFLRPETLPLFQNLFLLLAFVLATYFLFNAWQIDLTAWFASAGIAGVAIGFAAKDTLANLFSGVFILADAPYRVGDTVLLDSGERGEITHIGLRSTRMFTTDHAEITIPNSIMGNTKVVNQSGGFHKKARIRAPIGVAYGEDIDQVRQVLMKLAQDNSEVCSMPEPRVRFRQMGASSLDFELLFWIDNAQFKGRVLDAINTDIYNTFNELGIEIPYSKQDVYIRAMPEVAVNDKAEGQ